MINLAFQRLAVLAHSGHGSPATGESNSLMHYLLEPLHAPLWIAVTVAMFFILWLFRVRYLARRSRTL
jgi:hypothetical protein